jgi:WD40 repeat protein
VDLTLKADNVGKPDGSPPMPKNLPLEPVIHTSRMTAITGLAASPWAPLVAVAGQKQVLLFEGDTLAPLGILPFNDGQLVTCGRDFSITLWNVNGGKERNLEFGGELPIRVVFSCDDQRVFATDFAGRVTVWTVKDGKRAGELNANPVPHLVAGATVR